MGHTIGVDVGGTKIAGGLVDEAGVILARTRRDTPSTDPAAIVHDIVEVVDELRSGGDVEAVGVGSAGFVDGGRSTDVVDRQCVDVTQSSGEKSSAPVGSTARSRRRAHGR